MALKSFLTPLAKSSASSGSPDKLTRRELINELAPIPEWDEDEQEGLTKWALRKTPGAVSAFGNMLDYLGAGVRAKLAGKSALDHSLMSGQNKVWGRDLMTQWGLPGNKPTGLRAWNPLSKDFDPGEALLDAGGLATEIFTDPLTYTGLGLFGKGSRAMSTMTKSGRGLAKLGIIDEAADIATRKLGRKVGPREARSKLTAQDFIDDFDNLKNKYPELQLSEIKKLPSRERLGGGLSLNIPFTEIGMPLSPTGGNLSRAMDRASEQIGRSGIGSALTKQFDWSAKNWGKRDEQLMARRLTRYMDNKQNYAAKSLHRYYDSYAEAQKAFGEAYGKDIAKRYIGDAPTGTHALGDVIDHADLPGHGRVVGKDSASGNLIVSNWDQELKSFTTHQVDEAGAKTVGKAGSEVADAELDLLVNKAHDSLWRLATELDSNVVRAGSSKKGIELGFERFQLGDALDELGDQTLDFSRMSSTQASKINQVYRESIESLEDIRAKLWDSNLQKGLKAGEMNETIVNGVQTGLRHHPRYVNKQALERIEELRRTGQIEGRSQKVLDTALEEDVISPNFRAVKGSARGRNSATRDVPASILNRMYRDREIGIAETVEEVAQVIQNNPSYRNYLNPQWNQGKNIPAAQSLKEHAEALAETVMRYRGDSMYSASMIDDLMRYNDEFVRTNSTLDAIHETVAQDLLTSGGRAAQPGGKTVAQVFDSAGLNAIDRKTGEYKGAALEHLASVMKQSTDPASLHRLGSMKLTPEVANAIQATQVIRTKSEEMSAFLKVYDNWLNFFKTNVTIPFASFFMRNAASGTFVNLTSGDILNPADIGRYMGAWSQADSLAKGSLKDVDLMREIQSLGFVGGTKHFDDVQKIGKHLRATDPFDVAPSTGGVLGTAAQAINPWSKHWSGAKKEAIEHLKQNPSAFKNLFTSAPQVPGKSGFVSNPLGIRRFHRQWLANGSAINSSVEWMNRVPMYLYLKGKGYSPSAAARRVKELQFDYSELSKFEKGWMKRVMPFYTFQRKMGPLFFSTVLEKPGGALSQFIKASSRAAEQDKILPEYVRQNLAISNPFSDSASEDGGASYLTGFGLAHEDPMSYMQNLAALGRGNFIEFATGAGREALSRTTPYLKAPLELLSGHSFFQSGPGGYGRRLTELDPPLGRTISNIGESLGLRGEDEGPVKLFEGLGLGGLGKAADRAVEFSVANSPFSRYLSTIQGIADPRPEKSLVDKGMNLLTGLKLRAFTPSQLDAVERETLANLAREGETGKEFTSPYIDREGLIDALADGRISKEEFRRQMLIAARYKKLRERSKERFGEQSVDELLKNKAILSGIQTGI